LESTSAVASGGLAREEAQCREDHPVAAEHGDRGMHRLCVSGNRSIRNYAWYE
jgi:hypothetical protein